MATAWRYRLFRMGRMPPPLAEAARRPEVLVAAEGVSVRCSARSVRLPGVRAGRSVKLAVGSVVLAPRRLLLAVGRYPLLDTDLSGDAPGGQTVELGGDGVHLHVEVAEAFPGGAGTIDLRFRTPIEATALAAVPRGPTPVALVEGAALLLRRNV